MKRETLLKGTSILNKIERYNKQLSRAEWMISENVLERESLIEFSGDNGSLIIPDSLFKIIGKLIHTEIKSKLIELEDELENL